MVFFVLFLCVSSVLGSTTNVEVINGQAATKGQFPWQVRILSFSTNSTLWECSGAIISEEWVLTAAHCVDGSFVLGVASGFVDLNEDKLITLTFSYTVHEDFDNLTLANDIAVIHLDPPLVSDGNTKSIALAEEEFLPGVNATISGWGHSNFDDDENTTNILQYATVSTIDNAECEKIYGSEVVSSSIVCAIGEDPVKNPCLGDGGTALVLDAGTDPVHVGIFSFVSGLGCDQNYPAGYSRTTRYRAWIRENTGV